MNAFTMASLGWATLFAEVEIQNIRNRGLDSLLSVEPFGKLAVTWALAKKLAVSRGQ